MMISFSWFGLLLDFESCDKTLFSIPLFNKEVQHFKRPKLSFIDDPEDQFFSQVNTVVCAHYLALFNSHPSIKQSFSCKELVSVDFCCCFDSNSANFCMGV